MGKAQSHRASLKMAAVIRKKAKAKRQKMHKEAKNKQYPKRSKKLLIAPKGLPNREEIEQEVHATSALVKDVLKPIMSTKPIKETGNYDTQLEKLRAEIIEQQKANIEAAQSSYQELIDSLQKVDAVIEVLDARDPVSCQLQEAEGEATNQHKPLLLVLNKIDLVPREVVSHWIAYYSEVAPIVAVSALDTEHAPAALAALVASAAPSAKAIAVIGAAHVGKTHICEFNPELLHEVSSYKFLAHTEFAALLDAAEWIDPPLDLAIATVERSNGESIFTVLGVPPTDDPEQVMFSYAKKWNIKPKEAAKRLVSGMLEGRVHWYAVPNEEEAKNLSAEQVAALEASTPYEMLGFEFIMLNSGEPLAVDAALLGGEENEDGEEGEDDEENEEGDGEEAQ